MSEANTSSDLREVQRHQNEIDVTINYLIPFLMRLSGPSSVMEREYAAPFISMLQQGVQESEKSVENPDMVGTAMIVVTADFIALHTGYASATPQANRKVLLTDILKTAQDASMGKKVSDYDLSLCREYAEQLFSYFRAEAERPSKQVARSTQ